MASKLPTLRSGGLYETKYLKITPKNIVSELNKVKEDPNNKRVEIDKASIISPFTMPPNKKNQYEILTFEIVPDKRPPHDFAVRHFKLYLYPENKIGGRIKYSYIIEGKLEDDIFNGTYIKSKKNILVIYGTSIDTSDKTEKHYIIEIYLASSGNPKAN